MRSTRITALGIVVFLFLPILSGCLRIDLRCKPKYDIDEDSVFFSKMPPRTENGANIVAFEVDGVPYVFPKEGMRGSLFLPPPWSCKMETVTQNDTIRNQFEWYANRLCKKYKYNRELSYIEFNLSKENLDKNTFEQKGELGLVSWHTEAEGVTFEITKHDHFRGIICGRFSGVLKVKAKKGTVETKRIENGFFDLTYE